MQEQVDHSIDEGCPDDETEETERSCMFVGAREDSTTKQCAKYLSKLNSALPLLRHIRRVPTDAETVFILSPSCWWGVFFSTHFGIKFSQKGQRLVYGLCDKIGRGFRNYQRYYTYKADLSKDSWIDSSQSISQSL